MPSSKAKSLSSLFLSATKISSSSSTAPIREDSALKLFVSTLDPSSLKSAESIATAKSLIKLQKKPSGPKTSSSKTLSDLAVDSLNLDPSSHSQYSSKRLSKEISAILCGGTAADLNSLPDSQGNSGDTYVEKGIDIPWFTNMVNKSISIQRKELSRERKQKWIFKNTQKRRFELLVKMCGNKLGVDATLQVFGKLGRETGLKEYNALIRLCIDKARTSEDEDVALEQAYKAYHIFTSMKEHGFQLEEETYGPFLIYLIDMCMVDEFQFFCKVIRDENPRSVSRLAYYEMRLWIRVDDDEKIQELCDYITAKDIEEKPCSIRENYLLALCESDRDELLPLLDHVDITKFSSGGNIENLFKSLGRLVLESFAEKFILALKTCDDKGKNISNFIYNYAISMPNLSVEDVVSEFQSLHARMELEPSSTSYEKLIIYCCESLKVHVALKIIRQMLEATLTLTIETVNSVLYACEESYDYHLVRQIYPLIRLHNLKPNTDTFRTMITLSVRMKDFDGAYRFLKDLEEMNLMPTSSMYNAIMAGHFREKNISGALKVLDVMKKADVKPDSLTFSYLIVNCDSEEDIIKYSDEMKHSGVQLTKYVFMTLINAYASLGQFEKAKQVVLDSGIPVKNLNEIKSVLVSSLASSGQMSDALDIYEELKQADYSFEPKTVISLIEHTQSEGELNRLLQLLEELNDPDYWLDGCCRVFLYAISHKDLSVAVDLIKRVKAKFPNDEMAPEVLYNEAFCQIADTEPIDLQTGLGLLRAIKEELGLRLSRKSLDFLLSACVFSKDLKSSHLVWKEYENAGLPYNILSFLRMYQAFLASGDHKSAKKFLSKIPKDDLDVRSVITKCQVIYKKPTSAKSTSAKEKKKK